jgi:cell division septum initiation protein DivIVA
VAEHEPPGVGAGDAQDALLREIRDPSFPPSVRGYERRSVDGYVQRVNRLIAELQVSGSPRAAVRHALDRVGEQTSGILQRARETADEITAAAADEAAEVTRRATAEAEEIRAGAERDAADRLAAARREAEANARRVEEELAVRRAEVAAVADERRALIDQIRSMAARLEEIVAESPEETGGE